MAYDLGVGMVPGRGFACVGRSEKCDGGDTVGGGDMHRSAISGDEKIASADQRSELGDVGFSGEATQGRGGYIGSVGAVLHDLPG